jgi:hypothetical protein
VGILIDDASLSVETHSGLVVPALEALRNRLIESSAAYTVMASDRAFCASTKHLTPKLDMASSVEVASTAQVKTFLQDLGATVALVSNDPSPKTTGLAFTTAIALSDYLIELLT